jgi:hypothetical protein
MTQAINQLTTEQMTEWLYGRAEEIFLLCAIINRRGLAHAFCDLSGHIQSLDSEIFPTDSNYCPSEATPAVAKVRVQLDFTSFLIDQAPDDYQARMQQMDDYAALLDRIIEAGKPITRENAA